MKSKKVAVWKPLCLQSIEVLQRHSGFAILKLKAAGNTKDIRKLFEMLVRTFDKSGVKVDK